MARVKKSYRLKKSSELDIKREILRNGAVITDWIPPGDFAQYKTGLFERAPSEALELQGSENEEPKPTHASVIIGWTSVLGRNGDTSAWIVRNTRGKSFGMDGDFLVPRGHNDHFIESDILAFDVQFI